MKIILTDHAKQRMVEREISINQIEETINFPEYTIKKENKVESYKKIKNRVLKIVSVNEGKFIKIVTVISK